MALADTLNYQIQKYFIIPFYSGTNEYNYINSITYGLIAAGILFLIYKVLEKNNLKIDMKFFWAVLPFIFLGSMVRMFVDKKIIPFTFFSVSPGLYISIASIFLLSLFISVVIEKPSKIKYEKMPSIFPSLKPAGLSYWKTSFAIGFLAVIIPAIFYGRFLKFENLNYGVAIVMLGLTAFSIVALTLLRVWKWFAPIFGLPILAHMIDASSTFVAVDFLGFAEKHPLPTFLIGITHTAAVMYALKLIILIPAIYYLNKEIKSENMRNFILIAVTVLGLAEGLRNLLTVVFG